MTLMSSTRSSAGYFSLLARGRDVPVAAEEAVALGTQVEQALHRDGLPLVLARSSLAGGEVLTAAPAATPATAPVALAERLAFVLEVDAVAASLVGAVGTVGVVVVAGLVVIG